MTIEEILKIINGLPVQEQKLISQRVIDLVGINEQSDIYNIRNEIHESSPIQCPYCNHQKWIKFGLYRGSQKYRCHECKRTFTSLTGSSANWIHDKKKWTKYFSCLLAGYSLHKCAKEVGISYKTSFNWRHKILKSFRDIGRDKLKGIIEADETYFLISKKGQNPRGRNPRKRGGIAPHGGPTKEHVGVIVATDRNGRMTLQATGKSRVTSHSIIEALGKWVEKQTNKNKRIILCTDQYTAYDAFVRKKNLIHKTIPAWDRKWTQKKIYHLQHVNNLHSKLKTWIRRFNGVSTKYLPNYLIYFKIQEIVKEFNNQEEMLLKYSLKHSNTYLPVSKFHRYFIKQYYYT